MKFKTFLKRIIQSFFYIMRDIFLVFSELEEVSILTYHSISESDTSDETAVSPDVLDGQINFLKQRGYYFATLAEIVSYIKNEKPLPLKTVAFTIDDGYSDSYKNAFPVLKKYKIPATIFIVSDFEKMKNQTGATLLPLSESEKNEMRMSGLVDFQCHSKSHAMLDIVNNNELKGEVIRGTYTYFAYPGGHHNELVRDAVKQARYTAAFSIKPGLVKRGDDLFVVRRNVILGSMDLFDFKVRTTKAIEWYTWLAFFLKRLSRLIG